MKYTNSIYTPGMSGKQGAVVFSSNQYGSYSCQRRIPIDPKSPSQQNVRSSTANIGRDWAKLTPLQREVWTDRSKNYPIQKKGKTYVLPGFYFYMKLNKNLHEAGEPLLTDFPNINNLQPHSLSSFSVRMVGSGSISDLLLFFSPAINKKTKLLLYATWPLKVTKSYGSSRTYKIAVLDNSFVSGSSIKDYYFYKFQQLPVQMSKAFFEVKSINRNTGFTSALEACETYGI